MSGWLPGRVKHRTAQAFAAAPSRSNSVPDQEFSSWLEVKVRRKASFGKRAASRVT